VKNPDFPNKLYKVKVFRTGTVQIPGILREDFSDAHFAIRAVKEVVYAALNIDPPEEYLEECELTVVMMNYKWRFVDPKWIINLNTLADELREYADNQEHDEVVTKSSTAKKVLEDNKSKNGLYIIHEDPDPILESFDIDYNPESYQGLTCKLKSKEAEKHATFRVFNFGKINVTIKVGTDDIIYLKNWFYNFLQNSKAVLLINTKEEKEVKKPLIRPKYSRQTTKKIVPID
jgi:hypothetical protein